MKILKMGMSPCPNDTFMFFHLLHRSELSRKYKIELSICDIQELNQLCLDDGVDFCKISFSTAIAKYHEYVILRSGAALGYGCGPLVVSKKPLSKDGLKGKKILVPGLNTTALLLLKSYLGNDFEAVPALFSDIMPAIKAGEADAGLIIHESRFTYGDYGLSCVVDLGDWWEKSQGLPVPLGAIVASRRLDKELILKFESALAESVDWAMSGDWREDKEFAEFIHVHAREFNAEVLDSHIKTYVNQQSKNLDGLAVKAIAKLFECELGKPCLEEDFLTPAL